MINMQEGSLIQDVKLQLKVQLFFPLNLASSVKFKCLINDVKHSA